MHKLGNYGAVVFDFDGVLTLGTDDAGKFKWHKNVEADLGMTSENMQTFFTSTPFKLCALGQADTKQALTEFLPTVNAKVDATEFLDYWFAKDAFLNEEMVKLSDNLRKSGIKTYIGTNQERYRAENIWSQYHLDQHFDGLFASSQMGCMKPEDKFFETANKKLPAATNVLFIDDSQKNAEACATAGWQGYYFQGWDKFSNDFDVAKYQ